MSLTIGFAGTFDPFTNGHKWIVQEALELASNVIILLPENPDKKPGTPLNSRIDMITQIIKDECWENRVTLRPIKQEYTAVAARRLGIDRLIRGQRSSKDFDYECSIHRANTELLHGVKTLFVIPPADIAEISSSFVKSLMAGSPIGWHHTVKTLVPKASYESIRNKWLLSQWDSIWTYASGPQNGRLVDPQLVQQQYDTFLELTGTKHYGDPARTYHNLDHLVHGLCELDAWYEENLHKISDLGFKLIKRAFWFHDAVSLYHNADKKESVSDAELSARMWEQSELAKSYSSLHCNIVADAIRATDYKNSGDSISDLAKILTGADLSILGQSTPVYEQYMKNVRLEYSQYSNDIYYPGRSQVLQGLLAKATSGTLFRDAYFHDKYNLSAIYNLNKELNLYVQKPVL